MTMDQCKPGVRVRLIRDIFGGCYPGAMIATIKAGETGEITAVYYDADIEGGDANVYVRFDNHLPTLDEWSNVVFVGFDRSEVDWDTTIADFETLPS